MPSGVDFLTIPLLPVLYLKIFHPNILHIIWSNEKIYKKIEVETNLFWSVTNSSKSVKKAIKNDFFVKGLLALCFFVRQSKQRIRFFFRFHSIEKRTERDRECEENEVVGASNKTQIGLLITTPS